MIFYDAKIEKMFCLEASEEIQSPLINGEHIEKFAINLTRGQKNHYGAQFSNESPPEILGMLKYYFFFISKII